EEIGAEQGLDDFVLLAEDRRAMDQPMRVDGIGRARNPLEFEGDAGAFPGPTDPLINLFGALGPTELGRQIVAPIEAACGDVRVELNRPPVHLDRLAGATLPERRFQAPLADEAPGADGIGYDVDADHKPVYRPPAGLGSRKPGRGGCLTSRARAGTLATSARRRARAAMERQCRPSTSGTSTGRPRISRRSRR